jgi:hypothetical protein
LVTELSLRLGANMCCHRSVILDAFRERSLIEQQTFNQTTLLRTLGRQLLSIV